jgi:hypothetical protein
MAEALAGMGDRTILRSRVADLGYGDLRDRVRKAIARASDLGVSPQGRFQAYLTHLDLAAPVPAGESLPFADSESQQLYLEALTQCTQLVSSWKIWPLVSAKSLRRKLAQIFSGPVMPLPSPADDRARNTLLELTTAALLWSHHFELETPRDATDVVVDAEGVTFSVECKRPAAGTGLESNVGRLAKQLETRHGGHLKMAVIGADRMLSLSGGFWSARSMNHLNAAIQQQSHAIAEVMRRWSNQGQTLFPRVVAGAVVVVGCFWVEEDAKPYALSRLHVFPTGDTTHPKSLMLNTIVEPRLRRDPRGLV